MNNRDLFNKLNAIIKKQNRPEKEMEKIKSAFEFACKLHEGQYRASEEPYILHPLEVSCILADLQADTDTICAALLHDILEDTDIAPEEISKHFGTEVLTLVNGVTKLNKYSFSSKEERQAENFRKMFLAMADDIRIIFLKLADRLHNMRTLNYMKAEKQREIAKETLEIFAPLANRLGMGLIKSELEDLALRYTNPEKYFEIAQLVAQAKAERDQIVQAIIEKIESSLKNMRINAVITGRAKSYYSIYLKMQMQQKSYQDLYDITAVRVVVNSEKECYEVLGLIHSAFKPIPGRFKDYIAMPKNNFYRSLHTSVIGPRGKPLEVQIRTQEMHEVAEFGIAAHWKYKETGKSSKSSSDDDQKFAWLRKLIEIQQDIKDAKEYVDSVKLDLFSDQVFAFTPKGDVIDLPADATPLDFAYRIHTEVGHRCIGAMVNGKIVTLDTKLNNGDIVEVLTSKKENPRLDWINIVVTNQAKSRIRLWFKKNLREEHIVQGRNMLEHEVTKSALEVLIKEGKISEIAKQLNYHSEDDLFAALGYGEISTTKITNKLRVSELAPKIKVNRFSDKKSNKVIEGLEGMLYHISRCCSPVPGEPIVGVVTRSRGVSVHREDCKSLEIVDGERLLPISWNDNNSRKTYVTKIFVEVIDRIGVFKDVLGKISDNKTSITEAKIKRTNKNFALIEVGLEICDIEQLNKIILNINSVSDVVSIKRQQSGIVNKIKQN
ncbi:MAG TPA: bifunctional (p)ppGpp synthetase/guanosine-3',5'-bis(diphosphate) 3'-pyrophosphohydrolase [Candidatus Gastranaerophilales bacterium]|nr:bifunctional (p)ppGpp synthetase/guanosine-3',5'-bis(diphosphate) 3'-pyrophosphohydrolase [Candidatus Gastranaerophilales bacterium]